MSAIKGILVQQTSFVINVIKLFVFALALAFFLISFIEGRIMH